MENYTMKFYFATFFCKKSTFFFDGYCFLYEVSCILSSLVVCSGQAKGNCIGVRFPFPFGKERRDLMKSDVTIMDFTGIYEKERFYRGVHVHWIDCRDIQGTNCYCDEEGEQALRRKIAPFSAEAIHFIDSDRKSVV